MFEKKMKQASVPMSGRKRRAFVSPMTPVATDMTASVNISNRLRSVSFDGGTMASRPARRRRGAEGERADARMKMSTQKHGEDVRDRERRREHRDAHRVAREVVLREQLQVLHSRKEVEPGGFLTHGSPRGRRRGRGSTARRRS